MNENEPAQKPEHKVGRWLQHFLKPANLIWLLVALLLYWALRGVEWTAVFSTLRHLRLYQILILIIVNTLVLFTFVSRWWLLLRSQNVRLSPILLLRYWLIGFSFSYFLPGPQLGGGILQIYLLQRDHDISPGLATATVTTSKVLERIGNLLFLGLGLYAFTHFRILSSSQREGLAWMLIGIIILPIGYLAVMWNGRHPLTTLFNKILAKWPQRSRLKKAAQFIESTESEIVRLCQQAPLVLVAGLGLTLLSWGLVLLESWLALTFLEINVHPLDVVAIVAATQVGFLIPVPVGLGSVEAMNVAVFQTLGFDASQAISLVLLVRIRDMIVGGIGLILGGRSAWQWWQSQDNERANDEAA